MCGAGQVAPYKQITPGAGSNKDKEAQVENSHNDSCGTRLGASFVFTCAGKLGTGLVIQTWRLFAANEACNSTSLAKFTKTRRHSKSSNPQTVLPQTGPTSAGTGPGGKDEVGTEQARNDEKKYLAKEEIYSKGNGTFISTIDRRCSTLPKHMSVWHFANMLQAGFVKLLLSNWALRLKTTRNSQTP